MPVNYRKLWENYYGPIPSDELGRPYDIHHVDGNRANNAIENLRAVSIQEHFDIHLAQGDIWACTRLAQRLGMVFNVAGKLHPLYGTRRSEETRRKISETRKRRGYGSPMKGKCHTVETKEKISLAKQGQTPSIEARLKISETNKKIGKRPPSSKGKKWWKRGDEQMRSETCPGPGWTNGRVF